MNVTIEIMNSAWRIYQRAYRTTAGYKNGVTYQKFYGISNSQWERFIQTGKLHVTKKSHAKMVAACKLLDMNVDPTHLNTLIKIMEIRLG